MTTTQCTHNGICASTAGSGGLLRTPDGLRLVNGPTRSRIYTNAQIDDYRQLARRRHRWRPPLALTVRARFSNAAGEMAGTAGFGFWNDPFVMTGATWPTLPRALWFFYSSLPSNISLASGVPGHGWKAATIDALHGRFLALAPTIPAAALLMRSARLRRRLWPLAQRTMKVDEQLLEVDMTGWHEYRIEWLPSFARFAVDDRTVLRTTASPRGPLGFVCWLDNQYMVVTPQGNFRHGLVASSRGQWMEVAGVVIQLGAFKIS